MKFNADVANAPDYRTWRGFNVRRWLEDNLNVKLPGFTLGCAGVKSNFVLVGSDNPDSASHFLVQLDVNNMMASMRSNPVKSYLRLKEHVNFVTWSSASTAVCAMGHGNISLVTVREDRSMEITGNADGVHSDMIRELSFMPNREHMFASGGFDKRLCLVDLQRRHVVQKLDTGQVVGSVKWDPVHHECVAATVDTGRFYLFDARTSWAKPTVSINTGIADLYTSERFSSHDVLLGFGNGRIGHYDLRSKTSLSHVTDPYVEAIGTLHYMEQSQALCVGGLKDMSVWKHDTKTGSARFWSHALSGQSKHARGSIYCTSSSWIADDMVLCSDSTGMVSLYVQDWETF